MFVFRYRTCPHRNACSLLQMRRVDTRKSRRCHNLGLSLVVCQDLRVVTGGHMEMSDVKSQRPHEFHDSRVLPQE